MSLALHAMHTSSVALHAIHTLDKAWHLTSRIDLKRSTKALCMQQLCWRNAMAKAVMCLGA